MGSQHSAPIRPRRLCFCCVACSRRSVLDFLALSTCSPSTLALTRRRKGRKPGSSAPHVHLRNVFIRDDASFTPRSLHTTQAGFPSPPHCATHFCESLLVLPEKLDKLCIGCPDHIRHGPQRTNERNESRCVTRTWCWLDGAQQQLRSA